MTGVETVNHQEEEKNKIDYVDNYFDQPIDKKTEKAVKALEGIQQQAQATIDEIKDGEKSNETTENPVMEAWNKAKNEAF